MLRKLVFIFTIIITTFGMSIASADRVTDTGGYSYVLLTNNTSDPIKVSISGPGNLSSKYWGSDAGDIDSEGYTGLAPYETKKVLWFGRNFGIKADKTY